MSYESKLESLGYKLEPANLEAGKFVEAVRVGNLVFTSGQISSWNGKEVKGKVGKDLTVEEAYQAAKLCALNNLKIIKTITGSLDKIVRIVKVFGMVNAAPDFDNTPAVINGCSDLLLEIFGNNGKHARSAIGMVVPLNWAVEIEMVVEVK
jgi:enamine deaminase RidA (YjgF/YER057c/UK114 family)